MPTRDVSKVIEVKGISKAFGDNQVLKNVSLTVHKGEVISVIGPSGCGKSTFIRSLVLLETVDDGKIYLNGEDLTSKDVDVNKVRQKIGMVFQSFNLPPLSPITRNVH